MPRRHHAVRRRHKRGDSSALSWAQIEVLFTGGTFEDEAFESTEHRAKAWSFNRAQILRLWFDGVPASEPATMGLHAYTTPQTLCRPWGWWHYDSPERRRLGVPARKTASIWKSAEEIALKTGRDAAFFGAPSATCGTGYFKAEEEDVYLRRLDLLTDAERNATPTRRRKP
jgi:hypothetical protein